VDEPFHAEEYVQGELKNQNRYNEAITDVNA